MSLFEMCALSGIAAAAIGIFGDACKVSQGKQWALIIAVGLWIGIHFG